MTTQRDPLEHAIANFSRATDDTLSHTERAGSLEQARTAALVSIAESLAKIAGTTHEGPRERLLRRARGSASGS